MVRERKWVLLATLVVVVAAVLAYSLLKTPTYRATASIARVTVNFDEILFGSAVFSSDAARQLETGANLVKEYRVAQMVQQELQVRTLGRVAAQDAPAPPPWPTPTS